MSALVDLARDGDIAVITTEDAVLVLNMAQLERDPLLMKRLLDELVAHGQDGYL